MREGSGSPDGNRVSQPVLVSACLLGVECNHRGLANASAAVQALAAQGRLVPICPETMGGLPTPRLAAALQPDATVRNEGGEDVTDHFRRGARAAVALARATGAMEAVLKARSPSCGAEGVTTAALRAVGLAVRSEEDVEIE